ncbi:N-acetylated-alpha-linked acidic dipeptidase 2-like isoform X2 [Dreissena polymorpha]|uniref:Uncharacterized protein n=1 Tax=Dreissena polymorpha TaxID=45954 RepID=A0A9D4GQC1_DREPO|nr:N-acetylated-alpha-linked acidic dipeptidase 2-like isoform X2 [Dreissena polymorpha]KAH3821033.1 hypothetical protein DPMN_122790 [Dreissena polymorpha]
MALRLIHQVKRMPSKGRYTAGKQVSRWEASDSDNIDIEYKNLEGQTADTPYPSCTCPLADKKGLVIKALVLTVVFGIGLVFGFLLRKSVEKHDVLPAVPNVPMYGLKQDYDRAFSRTMQDDLNEVINYEDHMKIITEFVHMSGLGSANKLIDYVEAKWRTFPFDSVKVKRYNVTLSYPNYTNIDANIVTIQASNGSLIFQSQFNRSSEHPEYLPFSAYSPTKNVTTKNIVYGHYARAQDLKRLREKNVAIKDAILIVRYGKITPAKKVQNAEAEGAAGVILYSDPADYANNQSVVFPASWWLPGWAVQLSHVRYQLSGDPSTPDYSSITGVHHLTEPSSHFPKIPVQPIRYDDARILLSNMNGDIVDNDWFGGLNITYRYGPGYVDNSVVTLNVDNMVQERNITNIIGVIKGNFEADKYVIIGAHIDSWMQGGVDSGTGYTILQELARCFAYHMNKGWKPRRSIMFALWDAAKYGNIGSYEWAQEYEQELKGGAVAYINLDAAIRGDYSFSGAADPLLRSVLIQAAQTVLLNCSGETYCSQRRTVYQQWLQSFPDPTDSSLPRFEPLGEGSDHASFLYRLGVPVMFPRFTYDTRKYPSLLSYPAFGALEDTKTYVETLIDPGYALHITMSKVLCDVILRLADSAVLPYDLDSFASALKKGNASLSELATVGDIFSPLRAELKRLMDNTYDVVADIVSLDKTNISEFDLYIWNNRLTQLSRAFLSEPGLSSSEHYMNLLHGPDSTDANDDVIFPGVIAASSSNNPSFSSLYQEMSRLILALRRANNILTDEIIT